MKMLKGLMAIFKMELLCVHVQYAGRPGMHKKMAKKNEVARSTTFHAIAK